jgi:hypothetical protein
MMEITKSTLVLAQAQYTNKPTNKDLSTTNETPKETSNTETVTLSSAALELLNKEPPMTPMFGGGTTLPPWPPEQPK